MSWPGMGWLRALYTDWRSSFWFTPSLMVAGSIVLAIMLIDAESHVAYETLARWPKLFGAGADGARGMLSTIAGSMMTVVGITFSITLITLSLASSQYTPRILRNFMSSHVMQISLGLFVSIFTYCLIVLRTIRGGDEGGFVPHIAVLFSLLLALAGVAALILFIHHVAVSIQASTIIGAIEHETRHSIERLFPHKLGEGEEDPGDEEFPQQDELRRHLVHSHRSGYLQAVNINSLIEQAAESDLVVRMEHRIGEFVADNTLLLSVYGSANFDEEDARRLLDRFDIGRHRTVSQDPSFGIQQLVDIALKALSPGINDTTTARMCIEYLSSIGVEMAQRKVPSRLRYQDGKLALIASGPTFASMIQDSFDSVRHSAAGNPQAIAALLRALRTIASSVKNESRRTVLVIQLNALEELAEASLKLGYELQMIRAELELTRREVEPTPRPTVGAGAS